MDITFRASGYIKSDFHVINSPDGEARWSFARLHLISDHGRVTFYSFYDNEKPTAAGFTIDQLRAIHEAISANITPAQPVDDEIPF